MIFSARSRSRNFPVLRTLAVCLAAVFFAACAEVRSPTPEPFISATRPPVKQEFRWSNGKLPKTFDPARAAAAPETDIVRAIFEGLTNLDPHTLEAVPAAAERWEASDDKRTWTFYLRHEARWSNGERVTAEDFVTSWQRLANLGDAAAHRELLVNFKGLPVTENAVRPDEPPDIPHSQPQPAANSAAQFRPATQPTPEKIPPVKPRDEILRAAAAKPFGATALSDVILKVELERPDPDFAKLVANPIFSPVYGRSKELSGDDLVPPEVSNGPFRIEESGPDGVLLERSDTYWDRAAVALERVRFVPHDTPDSALAAYKNGEIDVLTNAAFEPLAIKLLAPYDDFRAATHSALNFYEVNTKNPVLADRRVREALAISLDRDKIAEGELDGSTRPANRFLTLDGDERSDLEFDAAKARGLLERSGYPNGENFPELRLLVNRNDTQQRIAKTAARMWKQNLNIDVTVVTKDAAEMETARQTGDYELLRRGVVLPAADEMVSMTAIFGAKKGTELQPAATPAEVEPSAIPPLLPPTDEALRDKGEHAETDVNYSQVEALYDLTAIPIYFPRSYALVKPYVTGFELNSLDSVVLTGVAIDPNWQPPANTGK